MRPNPLALLPLSLALAGCLDPDEPGMDKGLRKNGPQPGDLAIGAGAAHQHVAERMRCCVDRWPLLWPRASAEVPLALRSCAAAWACACASGGRLACRSVRSVWRVCDRCVRSACD